MTRAWIATGDKQQIDPTTMVNRLPDFDPRTGDHLWMVLAGFRVTPDQWQDKTHMPMLDRENLLTITVPGCYYCEQPWTKLLASRRCKGEPPEWNAQ
jgi:hypothetical protein